ncbi:pirin family protein [Leptospira fainei serovar Hurstbridge str. BUT 6]|uniref:Pirin family protein n=1 Tax=Leptospira fainei serovar Hurstbridge str. BUT 6 TaxID=1193011 RepID=S3VAX9_9LEPT|nr:pirin family protein [Leptospira fainei]EPG73605.1 pirin family protein [Leptospira fainei serovar Hurstbridge str. BUT 6]
MKYISGKLRGLGDGFSVRRILPHIDVRAVGPFVFLDHMGPISLINGNELVVRSHPHIGLATITYLYDGVILHRDTLGTEQMIRPYEVNWMTAGSGIAHSERSQADPQYSIIEGIQTWVALPQQHEETPPEFFHYAREEFPELSGGGWELRLIAGSLLGEISPVKVYSPLFYADVEIEPGAEIELSVPSKQEGAVYVARGSLDAEGRIVGVGEMAVYPMGGAIKFRAEQATRAILLGGEPLPERRHLWWNFVSSSLERIDRAKDDWRNDRFGKISGETDRIPLPEA